MALIHITGENFKKEIEEENIDILLDFYATWCPPCNMVSPILEEIDKENNIKILKINIEEQPELASSFGVLSIPTLIALRDGKVKDSMAGIPKTGAKEAILKLFNAS